MASAAWYGQAIAGLLGATAARRVDWVNDAITVSLHTSSYTPDQDAHDFFNDTTNELSTGGYVRQTLGTKSINYDSATNTVSYRAATTTFPSLTGSPRYAIIWVETAGASSTDPLLGFVDLGPQSVTATNFVITWSATDGVLAAVVS